MKRKVKVGQEFDGLNITIVIGEGGEKKAFSFKKALMCVAILIVVGIFLMPVALGVATGDYSLLKAYAETGKAFLDLMIEIGMKYK